MGYSIFDGTMADMTWPQVQRAVESNAVVLFPTGIIEEHGPHMGLGVDTYLGYQLCRQTQNQLVSEGIETIIAPPYYWGINSVTGSFPGSFTVRRETMKAVLYDILASFKRWGFTYVFIINWHDDQLHCQTIAEAISEARNETGIRAFSIISDLLAQRLKISPKADGILVYKMPCKDNSTPDTLDIHAGSGETGLMARYFPHQVDTLTAKTLEPTNLTFEDFLTWRKGWDDALKITPAGYLGSPSEFDPYKGQEFMEYLCKNISGLIQVFFKKTQKPM